MNDATTQMGVQFGKSAVAAGQDYVEKNVSEVSPLIAFLLFRPRRWPGRDSQAPGLVL